MMDVGKPFSCSYPNCNQNFPTEETLVAHMQKHDLSFDGLLSGGILLPDQTPTPTTFLKDCESFGLLNDLVYKNPFDESFRKAADREDGTEDVVSDSVETPSIGIMPDTAAILNMMANTPNGLKDTPVFPTPAADLPSITGSGNLETPITNQRPIFLTPSSVNEKQSKQPERNAMLASGVGLQKSLPISQPTKTNNDTQADSRNDKQSKPVRPSPLIAAAPKPVLLTQTTTANQNGSLNEPTNRTMANVPIVTANNTNGIQSQQNILLVQMPNGQLLLTAPQTIVTNNQLVAPAPEKSPDDAQPSSKRSRPQILSLLASKDSATASESNDFTHMIAKQKLKETLSRHSGTTSNNDQTQNNMTSLLSGKNNVGVMVPVSGDNSAFDDPFGMDIASGDNSGGEIYANEEDRRQKTLERNRAAARRCRKKKKTFIENLQEKVKLQHQTNALLLTENRQLKDEVARLKMLFLQHKDCPVTLKQQKEGQLQTVYSPGQSSTRSSLDDKSQ